LEVGPNRLLSVPGTVTWQNERGAAYVVVRNMYNSTYVHRFSSKGDVTAKHGEQYVATETYEKSENKRFSRTPLVLVVGKEANKKTIDATTY